MVTVEDTRTTGLSCALAHTVVAPRARLDECRSGWLLITGKALKKTGHWKSTEGKCAHQAAWRAEAAMVDKSRP
ncbi:MAG: hypothetical protein ACK4QP_23395 [Pseudorhizobium sp.]